MKRTIWTIASIFCLLLIVQVSTAYSNDPTTRFVQTCVRLHIKNNYPGASVQQMSPIGKSTYDGKHAWYVKAIFGNHARQLYGEFWVQAQGKRPSDLRVVHEEVRQH